MSPDDLKGTVDRSLTSPDITSVNASLAFASFDISDTQSMLNLQMSNVDGQI